MCRCPHIGWRVCLFVTLLQFAIIGGNRRFGDADAAPQGSKEGAAVSKPATGAPSDAQKILRDARAALNNRDPAAAVSLLAKLSDQDGASHFAAGEMLSEAKAYREAAHEFGLARRTYRDGYAAGLNQALALVNAGDYHSALDTANDLLNQGHETAELANLAGTAYLKLGQKREAYNALRLATRLNPKDEQAYIGLCQITLDLDDYDRGLEVANIGIAQLPNSERLYVLRGVLYAMKGQSPEAGRDFTAATKLAPGDPLPVVAASLVTMQSGELNQAVDMLRGAAKQHPEDYFAQYWYAVALMHAGAVPGTPGGEEVLTSLRASVRDNPDFWHSRAELGKALLSRDDVDGAIEQLTKANELNPKATSPLYLLAQCYRRKGNSAKAAELGAQVSRMQAEEREAQTIPPAMLKQLVTEGAGSPERRNVPH